MFLSRSATCYPLFSNSRQIMRWLQFVTQRLGSLKMTEQCCNLTHFQVDWTIAHYVAEFAVVEASLRMRTPDQMLLLRSPSFLRGKKLWCLGLVGAAPHSWGISTADCMMCRSYLLGTTLLLRRCSQVSHLEQLSQGALLSQFVGFWRRYAVFQNLWGSFTVNASTSIVSTSNIYISIDPLVNSGSSSALI